MGRAVAGRAGPAGPAARRRLRRGAQGVAAAGGPDADGALTDHGRRLTRIPLSPRLAHMVAVASDQDDALSGACIAAVLSEPGLGGSGVDLSERLRGLGSGDRPLARARDAMKLADRWAKAAGNGKGGRRTPAPCWPRPFPNG